MSKVSNILWSQPKQPKNNRELHCTSPASQAQRFFPGFASLKFWGMWYCLNGKLKGYLQLNPIT